MIDKYLYSVLIFLTACSDASVSDLQQYVDSVYEGAKPLVEPLPEILTYASFHYTQGELRNPFSIMNVAFAIESVSKPDSGRKQQALEHFSLDELTIVGTIVADGKSWVLVRGSDRIVYRATVGDYMGRNEGEIILIDLKQQKMVLSELVSSSGAWVRRRVDINIKGKCTKC